MSGDTAVKRTYFATLPQLREMLDFIRDEAHRRGANSSIAHKIELASEEALVNIVNYSYPTHAGKIDIACYELTDAKAFQVVISDQGIPYNPLACMRGSSVNPSSDEPSIGGYGIFLMLHLMDEVDYKRVSNGNVLTLTKYFA